MKQKLLISTILLAGVSSVYAAQGDWIQLDDMEDSTLSKWTLTQSEDGLGRLDQVADPLGGTGNTIYVNTMGTTIGWAHTSAVLPLVDPISDGETGTIYLKYYQVGQSREYVYGFTDVAISEDMTLPNDWAHFEGMVQMAPETSEIKVRDGGSYRSVSADASSFAAIESGTWYEVWMVVNNRVGSAEDTYSTYIKGGAYTEQTLLQVAVKGADDSYTYFDDGYFRYGTGTDIVSVFVRTLSGNGGSNLNEDVYLDHVAQAPGVELTAPINWDDEDGETWAGYPVGADGSVDTGDWLGWLNVNKEPWIYSYTLNDWIYIKEADVTEGGSWVYFKK